MVIAALLVVFALINIFLLVSAFLHIRNNNVRFNFIINRGFLLGIFVWEDALIITLYNLVAVFISYLLQDFRWLIMAFLVFWFVRGLGETFYYMLQQFIENKSYPHNENHEHGFWKLIFGDISPQKHYVLVQVSVQMITAVSLLFMIMLFNFWDALEFLRWF